MDEPERTDHGLDDPRIAAALAPLPADAPKAADFRYDPQFEAVANEIAKLERVGPAGIRWADVARDAQAILAAKSKDLTVASWLAVALAETEALSGLATGLAILRNLIESQWDTLFPQRPRARAGAIEWLTGRAGHAVPAQLPDAAAGPSALAAFEEIDALDRLLADKLADPPALGELLRPLRGLAEEHRRAEAQRTEQAEATGAAAAASTQVSAAVPSAAAAIATPAVSLAMPPIAGADTEALFGSLREAVRTAALGVLAADLGEPRAYQMLRAITWVQITELPPARGGRTELMSPPETRRTEFEALAKAGNGPDLVLALETFCSGSGLFWLDGQRLSAITLAGMGGIFAACSQMVVQGVQAMLRRLPGLEALGFSDGTPFADGTTRGWIENIVLAGGSRQDAGDGTDGPAPWNQGLQAAREQAGNGEIEAALVALTAGAAAAPSGRARFLWRLAQATLCLESGAGAVAVPVLRELDRLIDAHGLETWEPGVAAQAALMLNRSLSASDADRSVLDGEREALASAAFARLARIDPVAAARLAGGRHE